MAAPRIVLVTGANSGVGFAIARVLASSPPPNLYHIIVSGRTHAKAKSAVDQLTSALPASPTPQFTALELDVINPNSISVAVETVSKQFGHIDALINNAAVGDCSPDTYTRFRACLDTNVIGPALVAEAFRPLLLKSANPYSIFISSGAGSVGRAQEIAIGKRSNPMSVPNGNAYGVSKAAGNSLAVLEMCEWGLHAGERSDLARWKKEDSAGRKNVKGLKVFAICPGFVVSNLRRQFENEKEMNDMASDPLVSGETVAKVLRGERDEEVGCFLHKDGQYPW